MKKRTYHWEIETEEGQHEIILDTIQHQHHVQVDQLAPIRCSKPRKGRCFHQLELDGHQIEIIAYNSRISGREVSLTLDDKWLPGAHEIQPLQQPEPEIRYLRNRVFLERLAQQLGLKHIILDPEGNLTERLVIGIFNGFLCTLRAELNEEDIPYYRILIRHEEIRETTALKKELSRALRKIPFFRDRGILYAPYAGKTITTLGCYLASGQAFMDKIQNNMETMTAILRKYTRPTDPKLCEKDNCPNRFGNRPELVIINKFPLRWCSTCLHNFREHLAQEALAYRKSPSRFGEGVAASALTLLAASAILAAAANLGSLMLLFAIFMPMLAILALLPFLERSGIKLTRKLFTISAVSLAAISPLGLLLAFVKQILQNPDTYKRDNILLQPGIYLGKEWMWMLFIAVWTLIMVIPLQRRIATRHREMLKQRYDPQIFVVDN